MEYQTFSFLYTSLNILVGEHVKEFVVVVSRIVYPLQAFSTQKLEKMFSILERDTDYTYKRVSSPSPVLNGEEIYIEGEIPVAVAQEISRQIGVPTAIRFELPSRINALIEKLHYYSCFYLDKPFIIFIGTALINIKDVLKVSQVETKKELLQLLFRTNYVSTLKHVLAVKPKGLLYSRREFLEFVFPYHPPEFLLTWINEILKHDLSSEVISNVMSSSSPHGKGFYSELKQRWEEVQKTSFPQIQFQQEMNLRFALQRALLYSGFTY